LKFNLFMEDLYNLGVKAIIRNNDGRILILKVDKRELMNRKGWNGEEMYDLPGGRVERGKTVEDTLKAEIEEETGLTLLKSKVFAMTMSAARLKNSLAGDVGLILAIYEVEVDNKNIRLNKENVGYEWMAPKEAAEKLLTKYPKDVCEKIAKLN